MRSISDYYISNSSSFISSFFKSDVSLNKADYSSSLINLIKFVLQSNDNLIDFLVSFYSELKQIDDNKSFKDLYDCLPKNLHICVNDVIEHLGLIKDGKTLFKEYNLNFRYDSEVITEIKSLASSVSSVDRVLNLYSGLGILKDIIQTTLEYKHIDCYDSDEKLNEFNKLINSNPNIKIKKTDILHGNDIIDSYDLVIADIPENIKNIIYAKLCTKIKDLKIRGTKSEPLIIQLISQLLNPNGKAIVIVSNSFLFGDSKQHIETRKFIYENSLEIQIINLSTKKSILFWTKSAISNNLKEIKFKNVSSFYTANDDQVKTSNYSFYYSNYVFNLINKIEKDETRDWIFEDIIEIIPNSSNQNNLTNSVLYSYSNSNFGISSNPEKYDYIFLTKDENYLKQQYLNNYFSYYFKSNIDIITKGKTKNLCLDKINKLLIKKISIEEQNNIISYIVTNEQIQSLIEKQISNIENIRSSTFNSFKFTDFVKISSIATISNQTDGVDSIGIYKNSSMAGKVFKVSEPVKSDNIYFITPNNNDITADFLYNYMLNKQDSLIELAKINNTVSLSKKHIESFEVPKPLHSLQNIINKTMANIGSLVKSYLYIPSSLSIFNSFSATS